MEANKGESPTLNISLFIVHLLKGNVRNFQKLKKRKYLIKYYIKQKRFCLKIHLFMFLAYFIFVISQLKIHPAVHLNTSKALTSL